MADTDTARVTAQVKTNLKRRAEAILKEQGISVDQAINLFYKEITHNNGLPFSQPPAPQNDRPIALASKSKAQIDSEIAQGLSSLETDFVYRLDEIEREFAVFKASQTKNKSKDVYHIVYSALASRDLNTIVHYYSEFGKQDYAVPQIMQLGQQISTLTYTFMQHGRAAWDPWRSMDIRKVIIDGFAVFYKVEMDQQQIGIIRIFYSGKEVTELLKK